MGELSGNGGGIQGEKIAGDNAAVEPTSTEIPKNISGKETSPPKGVPTDVDDVFADAVKGDAPVFDVSQEEFNNNMKMDRRRLRFRQGSKAAEYMRKTKYTRPFWIRNTKDGFMRKISR